MVWFSETVRALFHSAVSHFPHAFDITLRHFRITVVRVVYLLNFFSSRISLKKKSNEQYILKFNSKTTWPAPSYPPLSFINVTLSVSLRV